MRLLNIRMLVKTTVLAMLLASNMQANATELAADVISVNAPYFKAHMMRPKLTAIFMTLKNNGHEPHILIAAYTPQASQTIIHHMQNSSSPGHKDFIQIPQLVLKPQQQQVLQPGGLHIMLFGLKQPLTSYKTLPLTLLFSDGSWETLEVPAGN